MISQDVKLIKKICDEYRPLPDIIREEKTMWFKMNLLQIGKGIKKYIEYNNRINSKLKGMSLIQCQKHSLIIAYFILSNILGAVQIHLFLRHHFLQSP